MRLQDLLFTGMDIPSEAQKIFDRYIDTSRMTEDEEKAFRFGATEAFRAVRNILNIDDDHVVFHVEGLDCMQEFDLDELIEIVEEKEGY
jgi:hypothetical protein